MTEIPEPESIVALVEELIHDPWPQSRAAGDALFERVGWSRGTQFPASDSPDVADHFQLETREDGPTVFATSREIEGIPESVYLQLRLGSAPPDGEATACFNTILRRLTELHGEPTIP
ncbi:hypothetical protein [Arthrobacter psychrolactophilus]